MSEISMTGRIKVHPGKLDEFKSLAQKAVATVREKDSGTVQYDWFFGDDPSECVLLETYKASEVLLGHMGNVGETTQALFSISDMTAELFGTPSEDLMKVFEGMNIPLYSRSKGL